MTNIDLQDADLSDCSSPGEGYVGPPHALIPTLDLAPDPELVAQGWTRRFMADPIRAQEAIDLYTGLGFEVRTEAIKPTEFSDVCGDCRLAICHAYLTIYTRKPGD